jgi:hypothetical protein
VNARGATHWGLVFGRFLATGFTLGLFGCSSFSGANGLSNPVVGAWLVKEPAAPFPYHMYVFNADGTMQQANPDAGDETTSDSDGKGVWIAEGQRVRGKWVEVTADRSTHQFVGRGELSFDIVVNGNRFAGPAVFRSYDSNGTLVRGPINAPLAGERVVLP